VNHTVTVEFKHFEFVGQNQSLVK